MPVETWLNSKMLYRIPKQQKNAGVRALGRLAFVDNYRIIARRKGYENIRLADVTDAVAKARRH